MRSSRLMATFTAWRNRTSLHGLPAFRMLKKPNTVVRAPRARGVENSPMLLTPAEFAVKLTIAYMQHGDPSQRPAIWLGKDEPNRVGVDDFQSRPGFEVHKLTGDERLF